MIQYSLLEMSVRIGMNVPGNSGNENENRSRISVCRGIGRNFCGNFCGNFSCHNILRFLRYKSILFPAFKHSNSKIVFRTPFPAILEIPGDWKWEWNWFREIKKLFANQNSGNWNFQVLDISARCILSNVSEEQNWFVNLLLNFSLRILFLFLLYSVIMIINSVYFELLKNEWMLQIHDKKNKFI